MNNKLNKFISDIPGGRFFRLRYISHLPVKAEFEKQGFAIFKIVNITARTGVKYTNIKGVELSDKTKSGENNGMNNWEWIIPNKIKYNSNTDKEYLVIAPIKDGSNAKSTYILSTPTETKVCSKEDIENYIIKSHWTKENNRPINMINTENILCVGNVNIK